MRRTKQRGYVRTYFPNKKHVQLKLHNAVHEADNPSPDVLPVDARALWDDVFEQAEGLYGEHGGDHNIPEKTAWRRVRLHWEKKGKLWAPRTALVPMPFVLPSPEDVTWLGLLLDYVWITPEGDVEKRTFSDEDPPDLWWSHDTKTLYAFPTTTTSGMCSPIDPDMEDQAAMYRRWSQREAQCQLGFEVPLARMYPRGVGDSLSYRSDKWHDRNEERGLPGAKEYIHLHSDGVWVYEDCPDICKTPNVVVIRGGRLDVEERGIIH